jgi:hypothetical protein
VTIAEGEIGELHVGLKGTMNALFLKDLAQKTRRGSSPTPAHHPNSHDRHCDLLLGRFIRNLIGMAVTANYFD